MDMTTNSTGTGSPQGPQEGLDAAASAFESMMAPPEEDKPEEEEANAEAEAQEEQEAEATDAEEATEEESEEAAEESESEDEEQEEAEPAAEVFTVKIDGTEVEVSKDELIAGYSRTSDYTRKTQQVAEQRKALEAEQAEIRAEREEYGTLLPKLRERLEAGMGPEPDWQKLREEDPARAAVVWQMREDMRRHVQDVKAEEARVQQLLDQERAQEAERRATYERNALLEKLPDWRDEKVAIAEAGRIKKMMRDVGFEDGEMSLPDHRLVLIARKAAKYDEMIAKSKELKSKQSKAPVVKPGGGVQKKSSPVKESQARLKKTGSVRDAADWFANSL